MDLMTLAFVQAMNEAMVPVTTKDSVTIIKTYQLGDKLYSLLQIDNTVPSLGKSYVKTSILSVDPLPVLGRSYSKTYIS